MAVHSVILAAGQGTRMRSSRPKVLQTLAGRSLLAHVLHGQAEPLSDAIHIVYGHGGDAVRAAFNSQSSLHWVEQREQLGTGHAVAQALPQIPDDAVVLVLYGDVPMVGQNDLQALCAKAAQGALAILSVDVADPAGYGRILRSDGNVVGIVEHKDANEQQRTIGEINTGLLAAPAVALKRWVAALDNNNAQGEFYLTDCVAMAAAEGLPVQAVLAASEASVAGVNDRTQLAALERAYQQQQAERMLAQGLQLMDPQRFDLRGQLQIGRDCVIDINCVIEGEVKLADEVHIGPNCVLRNVSIGAATRIEANSVLEEATIGGACSIGPFARVRPGTQMADGARIGNFVETKKTQIGPGSKINHLSYVGDAILGRNVNIGAGTITCNYDGVNKHVTRIGDGAFIGSDTALVAPVSVGDNATIGAGSVISKDAPANKLTVARGRQVTVDGWQRPVKKDK